MTEFSQKPTDLDWELVKNSCRNTVGKGFREGPPSEEFKKNLVIAEHSPIRLLNFFWSWRGIKYWVSTEWSRHKFEKFIRSQRNDRQSMYDRNKAPQDAPVDFCGYANLQNMIDVCRKRLCYQATIEAKDLAEDFKEELSKTHPIEASVLVPNCIYRCGCPEMNGCGFWKFFMNYCKEHEHTVTDIQSRYSAYNEWFDMYRANRRKSDAK